MRLATIVLLATWTGTAALWATTPSGGTKSPQPDMAPRKEPSVKTAEKAGTPTAAAVSTLRIDELCDFEGYPKQVQSLVQSALALTRLELGYLYGSHDPAKGGMDCSGTVYHTLQFQGLKDVPRQSDEMCQWVQRKAQLHLTPTATTFESVEFADLKPGDLLFWTNTTETKRKLPVTHVMIYLGQLKKTGNRVVFGASDGRSFQGERRSGVSVFDFRLPRADSSSHFYGYGAVPGLVPVKTKPVNVDAIRSVDPAAEPQGEVPKVLATVSAAKPQTKDADKLISITKTETKAVSSSGKLASGTASAKAEDDVEVKPAIEADAAPKTATATTKGKTTAVATKAKRHTAAPAPKSEFERRVDQAVSSVRRFFRS